MTHSKRTLLTIAIAVLISFGLNFGLALFDRPDLERHIVGAVLLIAMTCWWLSYDAKERNVRPNYALVALLYIIGLPYYLFRSRGFSKGLLAIIIAVAVWIVPPAIGSFVGWYAGLAFSTGILFNRCFSGDGDETRAMAERTRSLMIVPPSSRQGGSGVIVTSSSRIAREPITLSVSTSFRLRI